MKRVFGDALISVGVVAMVLTVLVSVDVRVREQGDGMLNSATPRATVGGGAWREVGSTLVDAVMRQSIDHAPMMIFVVVAVVLLLFMVRT